jgi:hypothetical protein
MDFAEAQSEAEAYASAEAPLPKWDPELAALMAGMASFFILIVFTALADLDGVNMLWPAVTTIVAASGLTYLYVKRCRDRHFGIYAKELIRLTGKT